MRKISLLIMLAIAMCASALAQTPEPAYRCFSGVPMWKDSDSKLSDKERDAAYKDCKEKQEQEWARQEKFYRESREFIEKGNRELAEHDRKYEELRRKVCELRTKYREDGTDDPWCKGVAPRLDVLQNMHQVCKHYPDFPGCDRLLPISLGKAAPPQATPEPKK